MLPQGPYKAPLTEFLTFTCCRRTALQSTPNRILTLTCCRKTAPKALLHCEKHPQQNPDTHLLQENCPDPAAGNAWAGSRTFLRVREAHKRLSASIRSEHALMRDAHLTFRQVSSRSSLC